MSRDARQIEYEYILKEAENKPRKPVDKWFLNYCIEYDNVLRRSDNDAGTGKRDS